MIPTPLSSVQRVTAGGFRDLGFTPVYGCLRPSKKRHFAPQCAMYKWSKTMGSADPQVGFVRGDKI